ncbi:hypothetical protein GCM10008949_02850 [Deinococcus humi]|nr:hypothetical protein GCM10008949_02850 [Deinococcus humi]
MRIAYFLQLNMGPGTGVYRKVIAQATTWQQMGNTVAFYVATKSASLADDLQRTCKILGIEVNCEIYAGKLPPPFDGRLSSLSNLIKKLEILPPDIVYTRQDIYLPPLKRLLGHYKVVVEVNTNDLGELKNASRLFLFVYKLGRHILLGKASGIIYVSKEISNLPHYNLFKTPKLVIGNGIDLAATRPLPPNADKAIRLVFIGQSGQSWHGIDKIIKLATLRSTWEFNLIGISKEEMPDGCPPNVALHGVLSTNMYEPILQSSDCAIGSLALHRKDMKEASPLKVREYLGYGLPVIIGYEDTDLHSEENFILKIPNCESNVEESIHQIDNFIGNWKGIRVPRKSIESLDYNFKERKRLMFFREVGGLAEDTIHNHNNDKL